jgi:NTE family protein
MSPYGKRKMRIGVALSGGAAHGIAHVGVLDVLSKAGIPIDMIAGTSAGSIVGAMYAAHRDTDRMLVDALDPNWKKLSAMSDPTLGRTGFLKGEKIRKLLSGFLGGDPDFEDLQIPLACVATDIDTGEEIVIEKGPVLDAVRASISLPGIFTVVKREGRYLVDGGLTTPVPVNVVRGMGAEFVIAVNVNPDVTRRMGKTYQARLATHKPPNLLQIMMQSIYITTWALAHSSIASADVGIEPDLGTITSSDFKYAARMIHIGREAAQAALPEIRKKLAEL